MVMEFMDQVPAEQEPLTQEQIAARALMQAAQQGPPQPEQGAGMVAPYYSGTGQRTGHLADGQQARLNSVLGALKAAQPATDTGLSNAEFMYQLDQLPALSSYVKYGKTLGKSSDQSTDSWARSMGASAVPVLEAMIRSGDNRAQNEVAGANQRMSLLGPSMSQLADEPRPQMTAQNPRDYHANTLLQSADKALARLDEETWKALDLGMPPDAMMLDDKALAERAATSQKYKEWAPWIQRQRANRAQKEQERQLAQSRLGIGAGQNMQTPVASRPNAASKGAAMITSGVPNAAKQDFAAALKPAGGSGPVNPVGGGGVMSPQAPARQGGGPTIWPASRFRPPVPPAQALPPITLGPGDFKTGAVPMPAQAGGAVQPVSPAGGVKPPTPARANPLAALQQFLQQQQSAFAAQKQSGLRPTQALVPDIGSIGKRMAEQAALIEAKKREEAMRNAPLPNSPNLPLLNPNLGAF